MAANQTIDIKLVVSEEVSKQLAPLANEVRNFHNALASGAERAHGSMQRFGGAVRVVHREFSTLARLTIGGLVGGGVVAGIVSATKALGDMARQSQQLRYQAEALGTTPEFLETMSDGLHALGVDAGTAAHDVQSVISTLRDAETHGTKSSLFKALEHGVGGSGIRLWNQIKQQMAGPEGAEGAFKFLISRMQNMAPTGQRAMLKALGISSLAFKDLKEILPQLHKRIQLSREETQRLAVANANVDIEMGNIGRILGSAVMPGIEKITSAFGRFLQTENGKKFADELRQWSDSVGTAIAGWMTDKGPNGLNANLEALKKEVGALQKNFTEANKVIEGIGGWKTVILGLVATGFVSWLWGVHAALGAILKYPGVTLLLTALAGAAWLLNKDWGAEVTDPETKKRMAPGGDLEKAPKTYYEFFKQFMQDVLTGNVDIMGTGTPRPQPQSGTGTPKTEQERRADIEIENRERTALLTEMQGLTSSVGKVVDYFQIGGPEGTAGDSGFGAGIGGGIDIPDANIVLTGSRGGGSQQRSSAAFSLSQQVVGADPRRMQRAVERVAPGSDEDWLLRQERVLRSLDPRMAGVAPSQFQGGMLPAEGELKRTEREIESKRRDYESDPFYDQPGWLDERRDLRYNQGPFGSGSTRGMPINFSGGDTNIFGGGSIINALAREGGGGSSMGGSATVDIDVGGLGKPARNPAELFKPQPLEGAVQMQNVTHQPTNSLSFQ